MPGMLQVAGNSMAGQARLPALMIMCVQPSETGKLLGLFLMELVLHGYLRLAAACGCLRAAFTTKETSLAMADLHSASYFCLWLRAPYLVGHAGGPHTDAAVQKRILAEYVACGVSLADLIPQVMAPSCHHAAHSNSMLLAV